MEIDFQYKLGCFPSEYLYFSGYSSSLNQNRIHWQFCDCFLVLQKHSVVCLLKTSWIHYYYFCTCECRWKYHGVDLRHIIVTVKNPQIYPRLFLNQKSRDTAISADHKWFRTTIIPNVTPAHFRSCNWLIITKYGGCMFLICVCSINRINRM